MSKSKWPSKPILIHGQWFDSHAEGFRYMELLSMQQRGEISDLEAHPTYQFEANGKHIGTYTPDYRYQQDGALVVEELKNKGNRMDTAYRLRLKLMWAFHGIKVKETVV